MGQSLREEFEKLPERALRGDAALRAQDPAWLDHILALTADPSGSDVSTPSLDALLGRPDARNAGSEQPAGLIPIEQLHPAQAPLRSAADEEAISRLAASIALHGLLQPLLARPSGDGYEIVAGNRRLAAAQRAGLAQVPVVVVDLSDREALMAALVENLQRQDLSALDEARGYFRLLDQFGWKQDELAQRVGRSRSHISNTVRLLGLPAAIRADLENGLLTAGHARALLNAHDPLAIAERVVAEGLSVRATEALVRRQPEKQAPARPRLDADHYAFEHAIAERLGLMVRLQPTRRGGKITIYYTGAEELDAALRAYGKNARDKRAGASAPQEPFEGTMPA